MRRTGLLALVMVIVLGLPLAAAGCGDDDSGSNNNAELCGNGVLDEGEQCDGAELGGETCVTRGMTGGMLGCTFGCAFDLSSCLGCGNGQIEVGEVCDGSELDGQTCADVGNFIGGTLACGATCADYDTSGCEESPNMCPLDEAFSLAHTQAVIRNVDSATEDDTTSVSCEDGVGAGDRIYEITLEADGDLVITYDGERLVFGVFAEPSSPTGCFSSSTESGCWHAYFDGYPGLFSGLTAGVYYLVVSAYNTSYDHESDFYVALYPPGGEICDTDTDEDGDGDAGCADADCALSPFCMDEICDNGADDDLNGYADCADLPCVGTAACTGGACAPDTDLGTLSSVAPATASFDTSGGSDSHELGCGAAGSNDHVIAFTLDATAYARIVFSQAAAGDNVLGFYFEGGAGDACTDHERLCFEPPETTASGLLETEALPPGTYYVVVEESGTGGGGAGTAEISIELVCPPLQHDEGGICVWDTCAEIDCDAMHMGCNDTPVPSECEGCLAGYDPAYDRCIVAGTTYGASCLEDGDCPGTGNPGVRIFCSDGPAMGGTSTGGMCYSANSPECVTNGQSCTDDPSSRCVVSSATGNHYCFAACAADGDCRPGYFCRADIFGSGQMACMPITDCSTTGCNDPGSALYCDAGASEQCWVDACNPVNPCQGAPNATGLCENAGESFRCDCDTGFMWSPGASACMLCDDTTTDLGTFAGVAMGATGDSCGSTSVYNPTDPACTGFSAAAQELVYRLEVNAGDTIDVTMTPVGGNGQDSSLYLLSTCMDFAAASCLAGADITLGGEPESLTYTNTTGAAQTVYIVLDSYSGCGELQLDIN